jgi:hypothetical protein
MGGEATRETQGNFLLVRGVKKGEVIARYEVCAKEKEGRRRDADQRFEENYTHGRAVVILSYL